MIFWLSCLAHAQDYLSVELVQEYLMREIPNLESCLNRPAGSLVLSFSISKEGVLQLQEQDDCLQKIETISFPKHPQSKINYRWSLVVQDQKLFPIQLEEKQIDQLLPGLFSLQKEALIKRLLPPAEEENNGKGN